jgi:hypothetical protein
MLPGHDVLLAEFFLCKRPVDSILDLALGRGRPRSLAVTERAFGTDARSKPAYRRGSIGPRVPSRASIAAAASKHKSSR